jgi:hypothetical protein
MKAAGGGRGRRGRRWWWWWWWRRRRRSTQESGLHGLYGVALVVGGRRRASHVVHLAHLQGSMLGDDAQRAQRMDIAEEVQGWRGMRHGSEREFGLRKREDVAAVGDGEDT